MRDISEWDTLIESLKPLKDGTPGLDGYFRN